ncbi:MAG: hypothetical protein Q8K78_06085 [Planctomycetaceae bacterium]|nr:hypothetical protein [Planctomycetaceae bacterium]
MRMELLRKSGDHVDLDGWPSIVVEVIDSAEAQARNGILEDGLLFDCGPMGPVFEAAESIAEDPTIVFLKRVGN